MKRSVQNCLLSAALWSSMMLLLAACTITVQPINPPPPDVETEVAEAVPAAANEGGFASPEEAIEAYFAVLTQNDIEGILQTAAVEEMAKGFDFALNAERLATLHLLSLAPSEYPFYVEMNKVQVTSEILGRVKYFTYSLLSGEVIDGRIIAPIDAERVDRFIQNVDPARLAGIELLQVAPSNERLMAEPRYLENAAKSAAIYGADEWSDRAALFSFEGKEYYVGFTVVRYGERWMISSLTSPLANTSALGTPTETTEADFEAMTRGE